MLGGLSLEPKKTVEPVNRGSGGSRPGADEERDCGFGQVPEIARTASAGNLTGTPAEAQQSGDGGISSRNSSRFAINSVVRK